MKKICLLASAGLLLAAQSGAHAASEQWLTRYAPPVSRTEPTPGPANSDSSVTRSEAERSRQILSNLKGVVLVDRPAAVRKRGAKGSGVTADPSVFPASVVATAGRYLGRPMTFGDLDDLSRDLVLAFRDADRPVVNVVIPEQELTGGVLQVVVVVGRASALKVEGASADLAARMKSGSSIVLGQPVSQSALLDDLRYLNRNPFRNVTALYQPGKAYSDTEVVLKVDQQKPWLVYGGVESRGDRGALGIARPFVDATATNLLGLDEVIGYQFTTGKDISRLKSHVLSFTVPLMARLQFQATYAHTDNSVSVAGGLEQAGRSDVVGLYLTSPLPYFGNLSHNVRVGAEYKSTNNNQDFGGVRFSTTDATAAHGVVGYFGEIVSSFGVSRFDANLYLSPGGVFGGNSNTAFAGLRVGAKAQYAYARGTFEHRVDFLQGWRGVGVLTGQIASDALLPSETLLMGGLGSVRGFTNGKVRADSGYVANFTLYTPPVSLLGGTFPGLKDQLRLYGFIDHAQGRNRVSSSVDASRVRLTGAGLGVSLDVSNNVSLDVGYGWNLDQKGGTTKDSGAVHFRFVARY